ncbi:MAG TPA: hypothetical protein VH593_20050, partial [Ktedonobacteraceae bacterium]
AAGVDRGCGTPPPSWGGWRKRSAAHQPRSFKQGLLISSQIKTPVNGLATFSMARARVKRPGCPLFLCLVFHRSPPQHHDLRVQQHGLVTSRIRRQDGDYQQI